MVIAIRDITKGEEITVDYSLTEWGENLVSVMAYITSRLFLILNLTLVLAYVRDPIDSLTMQKT